MYINNSNVILSKSYYYDLEKEATKTAYNSYIKSIFAKAGISLSDEDASAIYNFEKKICQQVDTDDYSAYGIRSNSASIDQYAKNISVKSFIESVTDKKNVDAYIINANSLKLMTTNLTDANINAIKNYYKAVIITYFSPYLSEDISNSYQKMCSAIFGSEASTTDELAVSFVESYANTAVSREYAGLYYNEQKNQAIIAMVNDVLESYKEMLSSNEWLSDETKKEAINKLNKIAIKVGYNKTAPSYYNRLSVTSKENGGTLVQNIINMNKVLSSQSMSNVNGAVDKNEWALSPLTVNACYVPLRNEICIPMAVLESPLYSEDADYQTNLASVGSIIAHEVSHAFDPSGARYDADGNYRNWWTEKDENKFYDYVDDFTRYFGKYEVAGGVDNNGFNTILENVADVSGVTCITNIAKKNGYDMASFMRSYAKLWSGLMTDEYAKKVSKIDTHSVGKIRVNGVLSDFDQFYSTFDVQSGDGMYIAPENRVKIW